MNAVALPLTAQMGAELEDAAALARDAHRARRVLRGGFLWMPDPHGNAASITWDLAGGRV